MTEDGHVLVDIVQLQNRILTVEQFEELETEYEKSAKWRILNINFLHQFEED
jgi:hypothetical protein